MSARIKDVAYYVIKLMNSSDPFERVFLLEKAVLMLEEEELKSIGINLDEVRGIASVARSFTSARQWEDVQYSGWFVTRYPVVSIPWAIIQTEENYNRLIKPWQRGGYIYWSHLIKEHRRKYLQFFHKSGWGAYCAVVLAEAPVDDEKKIKEIEKSLEGKRCPACGYHIDDLTYEEVWRVYPWPEWSFFFEASRCLTPTGYNMLKNQFVDYANTFVFKIVRKLRSSLLTEIDITDLSNQGQEKVVAPSS